MLVNSDRFRLLYKLVSRILCCPATSGLVERVFSHSRLIMHPHHAHMIDQLLETLVYLKVQQQPLSRSICGCYLLLIAKFLRQIILCL